MAEESYPQELRYHREHDWVRVDGDEAVFGITWFAQDALGEVVYYDPPEVGATVGFRFLAPMLCGLFRMPRLGLGYRFGDGTGGWTIKIGGDRVIRLPLP